MDVPAISHTVTATGLAFTGAGVLRGVGLCAGADAATVTVHDGTDNTGAVIAKLGAGIGLSAAPFSVPVNFKTGIYLVVTGTTPRVNVYL